MNTVQCRHCGLPFRVRRVEPGKEYFCCTGCAVLSRVPVDEKGNFPVNQHLVSALSLGFLYFNQVLLWLVALLLQREGREPLADRFGWISAIVAFLVWLGVLIVQRREGAARGKDIVFSALCLALLFAAWRTAPPIGGVLASANAIWLTWSFRGLMRRRVSA